MSASVGTTRAPLLTLILLLLALSPTILTAQTARGTRSVGFVTPRELISTSPGAGSERLARIIEETLIAELTAEGFSVDRTNGSPISLETIYHLSGSRVTLVLTVTETESTALIGGGMYTGTADLALVTAVRSAVRDLAGQLAAAGEVTGELPRPPTVLLGLHLISPNEGAQILLSDDLRVGSISDGTLDLPFIPIALGSTIIVEQRLDGFYPDRRSIVITDENMVVSLEPLRPIIRWEISASWMPQRWAGAALGIRRYLVPQRLYVQSTNQLSTRYRFSQGSRASAVFDTRVNIGGYVIAPEHRRFRLGLMTGGGFTFSALGAEDTAYVFADPYFNIFSIVARMQFDSFAPFVQADTIRYGQAGTGYLSPGTFPYFSLGVIVPWQP
jgi:hypothetical protein